MISITMQVTPPRKLHYYFAHRMLREFCQDNPDMIFKHFRPYLVENIIPSFWEMVEEETDEYSNEPISIVVGDVNGCQSVVIQMPTPLVTAEAHLIGVVSYSESNLRYFTLELGKREDGESYTVFGEWIGDGHAYIGEGCEPEVETFFQLLESYTSTDDASSKTTKNLH